jgi:hypothetical protein
MIFSFEKGRLCSMCMVKELFLLQFMAWLCSQTNQGHILLFRRFTRCNSSHRCSSISLTWPYAIHGKKLIVSEYCELFLLDCCIGNSLGVKLYSNTEEFENIKMLSFISMILNCYAWISVTEQKMTQIRRKQMKVWKLKSDRFILMPDLLYGS